MDTKGGKLRWGGDGGVLNWAIGIDMYTLMCIKLMRIKNLQYKQTNKQTNKNVDKLMDCPLPILLSCLHFSVIIHIHEYSPCAIFLLKYS